MSFAVSVTMNACMHAGLFRTRQDPREAAKSSQSTQPPRQKATPSAVAVTAAMPSQHHHAVSARPDLRTGRTDAQMSEKPYRPVRAPQGAVDSTQAVWHSLTVPDFRAVAVQEKLEHWHMEATSHLLDSYHLRELLRVYMTVLDFAGSRFLPNMTDTIRGFTSELTSTALDVDVCSKRLLYLSVIPIVTSRGADVTDIDFRKTKAMHTLGTFYILLGRLTQLTTLLRESSKFFCRELTKNMRGGQTAKVMVTFTRLAQYSLDSLEYLMLYFRELHAAIMGATVHPLLVTRTYSHLHVSLQAVGQYFSTCDHARRIGEGLQREIDGLKAVVPIRDHARRMGEGFQRDFDGLKTVVPIKDWVTPLAAPLRDSKLEVAAALAGHHQP